MMRSAGKQIDAFEQLQVEFAACQTADAQQAVVDRFVEAYPYSPLIGADEAVIWYCGDGKTIFLRGDMLQEQSSQLVRLGQTNFHYHRCRYEHDARLDYHLLVDGRDIGDPRNPRSIPSRYGPRVELVMPGYDGPRTWQTRADVPCGKLNTFASFPSQLYPSTRTVWVYTPPSFTSTKRYPSVYFHDGGDYLDFASATALFDNLIADRLLPPCIAVFINPSNEHGRVVDYDLNLEYAQFICDELVPWIDRHYPTIDQPQRRAIVGASFGGLISLFTALQRPDVFGLVGAQSSFASRSDDTIIGLYRSSPRRVLRFHLIIGSYETHIGAFERDSGEANFLHANRVLRDVLLEQGYDVAYAEYHDGHSWGFWRARLGDALTFLLNPLP